MALTYAGDSRITAAVGNYFSILSVSPSEEEPTWRIHFGVEGAGFFGLRREEERFPLETADGLIGLYLEGNTGVWQGQMRFTHVSAHLADGSLDTPIAYSRETLSARVGFAPSYDFHAYLGVYRLLASFPSVPSWALQWGGSYFLSSTTKSLVPFIATDFKWKEESSYNPSLSLQVGLALNNPPQAYRSFRFYYAYFTGADPRGQFYSRSYTSHSFGIEMQI